jgi:undecaprenyl-diphosphatase
MLIGIAQATALFPGISRSGITITAAILLGFSPTSSAKFSFLMSIPVIALTGILKALQLTSAPDTQWTIIAIATLISGITAYLCIHYFLKLIQRIGLMPFAIYRIIMGAALLAFF